MMIHLFPKSGIQLYHIKQCFGGDDIDLETPRVFLRDKSETFPRLYPDKSSSGEGVHDSEFFDAPAYSEDANDPTAGHDAPLGAVQVTASPRDALEYCTGAWIPVPFASMNPFWSRVMIRYEGSHYDVFLAVDTHFDKRAENSTHLTDQEIGQRLKPEPQNPTFWYSDYMDDYIRGLGRVVSRDSGESATDHYIRLNAEMRAIVEFLAPKLPLVQFVTPQNNASEPVDVDLVVDFGNCRTCAIVMETDGSSEGPHFHPVPFRSRDQPHLVDRGTVDSRLVFSRTPRSVRGASFPQSDVFNDLSIVRLGQEARNIRASMPDIGGSLHASGMSSPKRYLWDDELQTFNWCFVDEDNQGEPVPIEGDILRYLPPKNPFGWPEGNEVGLRNPPITNHSRKSGLVFLMLEILVQAYAFMNSHEHRANAPITGGAQRRRLLRNVLLTFPTCMPAKEQRELKAGVAKAVRLWQRFVHDPFRFNTDGEYVAKPLKSHAAQQPEPNVHLECDEGMAIQLCYIYQELMGVWQNMAQSFFDSYARERDGKRVMRVASIDIGGGTTDFTIADHHLDPTARGYTRISIASRFTHGVRVGGDDVQRVLLERGIMRSLVRSSQGDSNRWRSEFAKEAVSDGHWLRIRQELVPELWVPLARAVWAKAEQGEHTRDLVKNLLPMEPKHSLMDGMGRQVGLDSSLLGEEVDISPEEVEDVLERMLGPVLADCAALIAHFDCDVLVLGGRLVGHPWIKQRLTELCPLPPDCIITLHQHPVRPNLFPFADSSGRIADAKTCVVVGATVHFHARTVGGDFEIAVEPSEADDHQMMGIVNARTGLMEGPPLFTGTPRAPSEEFSFGGDLWLGAKTVADPHLLCNPQWRIRWRPEIKQSLRQNVRFHEPFRLTLRWNDPGDGTPALEIARVKGSFRKLGESGTILVGRPDHFRVSFQTMFDDSYWLDTGVVNIEEEAVQ